MVVDHSSLIEAYRILGRLAQEAWANPQEVPLPIARVLLHARDHVGTELSAELLGTAEASGLLGPQTNATEDRSFGAQLELVGEAVRDSSADHLKENNPQPLVRR